MRRLCSRRLRLALLACTITGRLVPRGASMCLTNTVTIVYEVPWDARQ